MSSANQNQMDISVLIGKGISLLTEDMRRHPSFDPNGSYNDKNAYFERTMQLGDLLFHQGLHWVAEPYFKAMLDEIPKYEKASGKNFNRGMVYACLGIAQIAVGKFSAGIAHLLMADEEDRPFVKDPHGILNTRLWQQFEEPSIFDYLIGIGGHPDAQLGFTVDVPFLEGLVRGMDKQDRIFLEGTVWMLRQNLDQQAVCTNSYTQGRLYSGLKDFCLLAESLLRKKQIGSGMIVVGARITLGGLLHNALDTQRISYPTSVLSTSANDLQEFLDNLESILTNTTIDVKVKRACCLNLVRNFTGHHFDPSDTVTSTATGRTFFDMYETVLVNVLSAILYSKHINAI